MRVDRLEKLAVFLRHDVPPGRFDIGSWGERGFGAGREQAAGCALVWATRAFPGEGLRWLDRPAGATVRYEDAYGFEAAERFLEIPFGHVAALFSVPGSASEVAARLLAYIGDPKATVRELEGGPARGEA
jgi:hypothetical protein